jgi:nitrous oxidase accessory protein
VCGAIGAALLLPAAASGATIDVHPGPGALGKAIDKARANDTLKVHGGTYREDVTIDKPLELKGVDGRPEIDGRCKTRYTIRARSRAVSLSHLKVVGADEGFGPYSAEVDWHNEPTGTAQDLVVHNTCEAEYGINVFNGGKIKVRNNTGSGFFDSGIYIGGIEDTEGGTLSVKNNEMHGSNRGLIIEDSENVSIEVIGNDVSGNDLSGVGDAAGLFFHNSDGVLAQENVANGNGAYGIQIDGNSDDNIFVANTATQNTTADLLNDGTGNCGNGNSFGTTSGNPLGAC